MVFRTWCVGKAGSGELQGDPNTGRDVGGQRGRRHYRVRVLRVAVIQAPRLSGRA